MSFRCLDPVLPLHCWVCPLLALVVMVNLHQAQQHSSIE
jgi:hypothetical protein